MFPIELSTDKIFSVALTLLDGLMRAKSEKVCVVGMGCRVQRSATIHDAAIKSLGN